MIESLGPLRHQLFSDRLHYIHTLHILTSFASHSFGIHISLSHVPCIVVGLTPHSLFTMSLRSSFRPSQPRNIAGSDLPAVLTCRERPNSQNTNETTSETACGYSGHTAVKGSECGRTLEHNYRRKLCPRYPRTRDHLIELWAPRDAANRGQTRRGNRAITSGNSGIASNCDVVSTVIPLQSSIERQIIRYEMWLLAC